MGSIYANAILTIGATGAAKRSEGCFLLNPKADGGPDSLYKYEVQLPIVISGCYMGKFFASPLMRWPSLRGPNLRTGRWAHRAWVLQESFFSKRIVHFGAFQVHWECQENIASQMRPFSNVLSPDSSKKITKPVVNIERWWSNLLLQYTDLNLSVDGDRLPAIASIAKEIAEIYKLTYVAGVYAEILPRCLAWAAAATKRKEHYWKRKPLLPPNEDPSQRASSWSWAHWEGHIATLNIDQNFHFVNHVGGMKVVERGDEHSHHQSSLLSWSQTRRVSREQRPMKTSELSAKGFCYFQSIFNRQVGMPWPWDSVFHAILHDDDQSRGGYLGNRGVVVFDDPINAAPLEFDLVPIGSVFKHTFLDDEFVDSGYWRIDMSLAAERVEEDKNSATHPTGESQVQGGDGEAVLLPERYRRLGLVMQVMWRVPERSKWDFFCCDLKMTVVKFSPCINRVMNW
ncbi:uncharacterized protein PgNI_00079, partial [Pyricularia grisea]|uniref:Heterokaryon incompatibility domain-containing protein n=1 Tax=Pyricularia grisea TaxID=148305 RepID=A0A6P8BG69_PYRGI